MTFRRFRGTVLALLVLAVVFVAWRVLEADAPPQVSPDPIFRFEKEELAAFRIERPDRTIEVRKVDGVWTTVGHPWRPNRAMIRRVAHQLHDLDARANVAEVEDPDDLAVYGLGEGAIHVTVELESGRTLSFEAGDPNPTAVSWYLRPLPGDAVYVVKKSALDYWRLPLEAFREDRIATFDAADAVRLLAEVDGRNIEVERTGERSWRMLQPVPQDASREKVRMMLGRISALKALAFVEDAPADPGRYGLEPPRHRISVELGSGERYDVRVGELVPGTEPAQRYVLLEQDDAVYAVKDGLLSSFRLTPDEYRDRVLLGRHEWDVTTLEVVRGAESVALTRTADDWRWPDGQAVPGSTPKRVAGRAADVRIEVFHDGPVADAGLEPPWATVALGFDDGTEATLALGRRWELPLEEPPPGAEGPPPRRGRQYARLEGRDTIYEIDDQLAEVIDDLFREYGRKLDRDAQRHLDPDALAGEAEGEGSEAAGGPP